MISPFDRDIRENSDQRKLSRLQAKYPNINSTCSASQISTYPAIALCLALIDKLGSFLSISRQSIFRHSTSDSILHLESRASLCLCEPSRLFPFSTPATATKSIEGNNTGNYQRVPDGLCQQLEPLVRIRVRRPLSPATYCPIPCNVSGSTTPRHITREPFNQQWRHHQQLYRHLGFLCPVAESMAITPVRQKGQLYKASFWEKGGIAESGRVRTFLYILQI